MAVSNDDYVDFIVQYGGNTERCRVTGTALLNMERASRTNTNHGMLIAIYVKHLAEIECLALAKLQRFGHTDRGILITTEDLNP